MHDQQNVSISFCPHIFNIQDVPFTTSPSTAASSHRKPVSTGISPDSCRTKEYGLYMRTANRIGSGSTDYIQLPHRALIITSRT